MNALRPPFPPERCKRPSRRSLLVMPVLGVAVLALLWTVIAMRLSAERDTARRAAVESAALLAAALEQHTVTAIHQVDQITRFVQYEFEKARPRFDLRDTLEKGVRLGDTLIQVSVISADGRLIANTREATPEALNLSDREHFRVHLMHDDDRLFISRPIYGRVSHQWSVQITRRLNGPNGAFAGVLVVSENPRYFTRDFYNSAALGRNGLIAVVSDNGVVLARRTGDGATEPDRFSAAGQYPAAQLRSGEYADALDAVERIVAYRHLDGYPLAVMGGLAKADAFADYHRMRNVYLLMASCLSLAMVSFFAVATVLIANLLGREREMTRLAEFDLLTGLPNRYRTLMTLRQLVARPDSAGRMALLFLDIDNFKTVNDTLGHNTGDRVLQMAAARLAQAVDAQGVLSRIGGDEFLVILQGADIEKTAERCAQAIAAALATPFNEHSSVTLQASVGIALRDTPDENEIDLLKKADLAMYSAKEAGKGGHRFYSPELAHRAEHRVRRKRQLRDALAREQLTLVYHPKIDLAERRITGFEALLRWNHPQQGQLAAAEFIAAAETTGLIVPIGEFVIESACRTLQAWNRGPYSALSLAINLSAVQLWRGDLLGTLSRCLSKTGVAPQRLELEIAETALIEYPDLVAERVAALKKLGVRIVLDDFGTGYSSISYLNRFSVDTLKIDRSFVLSIPRDRSVCVMLSAIVNLARSLGLTVVVEGVENEEQLAWLAGLGKLEVQGFLFSRPVGIAGIAELIERYGVQAPVRLRFCRNNVLG